jgi:hypothetical protein
MACKLHLHRTESLYHGLTLSLDWSDHRKRFQFVRSCVFWFAQPGHYANEVRRASHEVPVKWIDGSRANFQQDFVVHGNGLLDVLDLDNVRRSVSSVDRGPHVRIDVPASARRGELLTGTTRGGIGNAPRWRLALLFGVVRARIRRLLSLRHIRKPGPKLSLLLKTRFEQTLLGQSGQTYD